jgi:hypothetical protein
VGLRYEEMGLGLKLEVEIQCQPKVLFLRSME